MSDVTLEVTRSDLRAFENTLIAWQVQFGKSTKETLRQTSRLVAVNLAFNTQPYSLDGAAKLAGERATARDIGRVYLSVSKVFSLIEAKDANAAKGFYKAALMGDEHRARELMREFGLHDLVNIPIGKFDPSLHNALRFRNRRGRISKSTKPRLIVTDPKALAAYMKKEVRQVGYAKSSFASCADRLGGARGIPLWAKRLRAPASVADHSGELNNPRIVMTSHVKYIDVVLPEAMRADALEKQRNKMQTAMRMALDRSARAARVAA